MKEIAPALIGFHILVATIAWFAWCYIRAKRKMRLKALLPRPIRTAQIMTFWNDFKCKSEMGHEIHVPMKSGRTAVFRLANIEYPFGSGLDWQWHDYEFVRYLDR